MEPEKIEKIKCALEKARSGIERLESLRKSTVISFFCVCEINTSVAYRLNKLLRNMGKIEKLDVILESGGGNIDVTAKIVNILRSHCDKLGVMVPFYAKSAATLIALHADELIICKSGELGPLDPIVQDPASKVWIPAHSIKEAVAFIEETKDPLVKLSMADKLPPLLLGAYRDAQNASKQYLQDALEKKIPDPSVREECIHYLTEKFVSHGYPIEREMCKKIGFSNFLVLPDEELENLIHDIHEVYCDLMIDTLKTDDILIIQNKSRKCVVVDGEDLSSYL